MAKPAWIALLLALGSCASPEWSREVPNPFLDTNLVPAPYHYWMTRVIDEETGDPIPGATMFAVPEKDHSLTRFPHPHRTAKSDSQGWIRLRYDLDDGNWFYVTAPGYAPDAQFMNPDDVTYLHRGVDLDVEVRDVFGDPVRRGLLTYYLGCGHTPDSREVPIDGKGHARLPCVGRSGYVFPIAPGIAAGDRQTGEFPPRGAPFVLRGPPAIPVRGRILDGAGRPIAGAYVGSTIWHHGPWTRTAPDGSFRLDGIEPYAPLHVDRTDEEWSKRIYCVPPPGTPMILRLSARPSPTYDVFVVVTCGGEAPDESLLVRATRRTDGYTQALETGDGSCRLRLPAGEYELVADGRLGPYGCALAHLRVGKGLVPERVELKVEHLPPLVRVDFSRLATDTQVDVASRLFERPVLDEERAKGVLYAPPGEQLALIVERGCSNAAFDKIVRLPGKAEPAEAPSIVLPGFAPTTFLVRCVGPGGHPVRTRATLEDASAPGEFTIDHRLEARGVEYERSLELEPKAATLRKRRISLDCPSQPGTTVDLGTVRLLPKDTPWLRVLLPDGSPAAGAYVNTLPGVEDGAATTVLDESGGTPAGEWEPQPGERVWIWRAGYAPLRRRLAGPGPWTLRWPGCSVRVDAAGASGQAIGELWILIDGRLYDVSKDTFELKGLAPGPHRILVAAPDCGARECRVVLGKGETRKIHVVLSAVSHSH